MKTKFFFISLLAAIVLNGCYYNGVTQPKSLKLNQTEKELVQHCNDFSFNLLARVANNDAQENVILSPLSASMLLGMMMNGADGETLAQMEAVTGFGEDVAIEDINAYYSQLIDVLPALDKYSVVKIANGAWVREDFPVRDTFVQVCKKNYEATVKNVPSFTDPKVLEDINDYASQHTNKRIKQVIDPSMVDNNTVMALLNALYFKSVWKEKFKKADTHAQDFTTLSGAKIKTDMMHNSEEWKCGEGEDYQLVELPYKGDKYCADVVLPAKGLDIRKWLLTLNGERWKEMISHTSTYKINVALPKFSLSYNRKLNEDLQALGMKDAFDAAKADFSRMSSVSTWVDLMQQYTFMQVDEEGTEAAAVTVSLFTKNEPMYKDFIADRPFLFIIRERDGGTILFTALIGHPEWQK